MIKTTVFNILSALDVLQRVALYIADNISDQSNLTIETYKDEIVLLLKGKPVITATRDAFKECVWIIEADDFLKPALFNQKVLNKKPVLV